jgi:hypothetical protein
MPALRALNLFSLAPASPKISLPPVLRSIEGPLHRDLLRHANFLPNSQDQPAMELSFVSKQDEILLMGNQLS